RGLDAQRPRLGELGRERLGVVALDLGDASLDGVAGKASADEDDEPVEPRDAVPAVSEGIDLELELLVLRNRRGHAASVSGGGLVARGESIPSPHPPTGCDDDSGARARGTRRLRADLR